MSSFRLPRRFGLPAADPDPIRLLVPWGKRMKARSIECFQGGTRGDLRLAEWPEELFDPREWLRARGFDAVETDFVIATAVEGYPPRELPWRLGCDPREVDRRRACVKRKIQKIRSGASEKPIFVPPIL